MIVLTKFHNRTTTGSFLNEEILRYYYSSHGSIFPAKRLECTDFSSKSGTLKSKTPFMSHDVAIALRPELVQARIKTFQQKLSDVFWKTQ